MTDLELEDYRNPEEKELLDDPTDHDSEYKDSLMEMFGDPIGQLDDIITETFNN